MGKATRGAIQEKGIGKGRQGANLSWETQTGDPDRGPWDKYIISKGT